MFLVYFLAAARRGDETMTLDRWVPFRNESAGIRCRIFIFPHAGGNAAFYRPLRRMMPSEIDLCPIELPGRAARLEEAPITLMGTLIDKLSRALLPLMDVPFGIFGHSVGAWTAFEAARRLRSANGQRAQAPVRFGSRQSEPSFHQSSFATCTIARRAARHSAPIWGHSCSSYATPRAYCGAAASATG